jgi:hypothetical protein
VSLIQTASRAGLFCVLAQAPVLLAQTEGFSVVIAEFQSEHVNRTLLERLREDFETLMSASGEYKLLERRRLGDVKNMLRNEATLRQDPDLVSRLRSLNADGVLFGDVDDDVSGGIYTFRATLVRLDSSIVWKRASSLGRGLIGSREHRLEALRQLLTGTVRPSAAPLQKPASVNTAEPYSCLASYFAAFIERRFDILLAPGDLDAFGNTCIRPCRLKASDMLAAGGALSSADRLARLSSRRTLLRREDGVGWPGICSDRDRQLAEEALAEARRLVSEWLKKGLVEP